MKKSNSIFRRAVSLTSALFIAFSGTPSFSAPADSAATSIRVPTSLTSLASESLQVSNKLGRLESFHQGSGPMIVHIQTAHGHYEAQKKIESILNQLEKEQSVTTVLVEGSWEKLYPEILNFFPDNPKQTRKLNDLLTHQAVVQGPELYLLNSKKAQGFGIEDEKSYLKNAADFANVVKAREESRQFLATAVDGIEKIASAYLSRELRDFLRREEGFQNGLVLLQDWLEELKRQVQANYGEDLSDAGFQVEWPMLVRYFTIQNLQTKINPTTFDSEKKTFLGHLKSSDSLQSLVVSLEQLLSLKAVHSGLQPEVIQSIVIQMMRALPEDFNYDKYPSVKALIGTLLLQGEIDAKLLTQEIEKLTQLLSGKMTKSETEKKIVDVYQRKILLSKLLELELTPADYEVISGQGAADSDKRSVASVERFKPSVLLNEIQKLNSENRVRGINFEHTIELDAVFEKALKFYAGAKARDQYMIENIELAIKALGVQKVAVVTGGFHAEPFREYFEGKGYSYGLVMPTISHVDEKGREAYLALMHDQMSIDVKSSTIPTIVSNAPSGMPILDRALRAFGTLGALAREHLDKIRQTVSVDVPVDADRVDNPGLRRFLKGALATAALAPLLPFQVNAQAPPSAAQAIIIIDKLTNKEIAYTGLTEQEDKRLFKRFAAGEGLPQKPGEVPTKLTKAELSLVALKEIEALPPERRVQFLQGFFSFLGGMKGSLDDKQFKEIQKLALIQLAAFLTQFKLPANVVAFFLSGLIKNDYLFKDASLRPFALALITEVAVQAKDQNIVLAREVVAKQGEFDMFISKIIKKELVEVFSRQEGAYFNLMKVWYAQMFGALLYSKVSFLDPYSNVVPPTRPIDHSNAEETRRKVFSTLLPTSETQRLVRQAFWSILNDDKLLKGITARAEENKFSGIFQVVIELVRAEPSAVEEQRFTQYISRNDIPRIVIDEAKKRLPELRDNLKKAQLVGGRSEARRFEVHDFQRLAQKFTDSIYALRAWASGIVTASMVHLKSLIVPKGTLPPLPARVKLSGAANVFEVSNATVPMNLSEPFQPSFARTDMQAWVSWMRYLAVNPEAKWTLWASPKDRKVVDKFKSDFVLFAKGFGYDLREQVIAQSGVLSFSENQPDLSVAMAVDIEALRNLAKYAARLHVDEIVPLDELMAIRIGALQLLKGNSDPFAGQIVKASRLSNYLSSFSQILQAVKAFASAA